jgi:hypothetical protein
LLFPTNEICFAGNGGLKEFYYETNLFYYLVFMSFIFNSIRHGRRLMYASEIMVADLNRDDQPELVLTTFGDPEGLAPGEPHGYLMILDYDGNILHDIQLPAQGTNGNGKGAPAAPTTMDLNGDGTVEIVVQTFGVGCFVFTVPDSAENQLLWPTGRGNYFRDGRPWSEAIKYCPGDLDRDNDIDGRDLALFAGDFDTDGDVGGKDIAAFAADFSRAACP